MCDFVAYGFHLSLYDLVSWHRLSLGDSNSVLLITVSDSVNRGPDTIRLSMNEDPKLEKGKRKERTSSAARSLIQSSGHVTTAVYQVLTQSAVFYQCRNITPPPKKPALRLCS